MFDIPSSSEIANASFMGHLVDQGLCKIDEKSFALIGGTDCGNGGQWTDLFLTHDMTTGTWEAKPGKL